MAVWSTIRRARLARGWTQEQLGDEVGLDQAQVSKMETGDWEPPREVLIKVTRALDAPQICLEALRLSPMLQTVIEMLGVADKEPGPVALIDTIRAELAGLKAGLDEPAAAARAAGVTDMCRMLTLLLAERNLHR